MIDIYSRYIVGAHVHASESGELAVEMMKEIFGIHGTPEVVHAERGTSMTSKTVTALLSDLELTKSHSRPRVSNDNPFSEAGFKTLKFAPAFPQRFGTMSGAREFMATFVEGYDHAPAAPGSGSTPGPTFTMGWLRPKPFSGRRPLPPPGPGTPNASPPRPTRRSSPCPADLGQAVTANLSGNDIVTGALHRASHHADQW